MKLWVILQRNKIFVCIQTDTVSALGVHWKYPINSTQLYLVMYIFSDFDFYLKIDKSESSTPRL